MPKRYVIGLAQKKYMPKEKKQLKDVLLMAKKTLA